MQIESYMKELFNDFVKRRKEKKMNNVAAVFEVVDGKPKLTFIERKKRNLELLKDSNTDVVSCWKEKNERKREVEVKICEYETESAQPQSYHYLF